VKVGESVDGYTIVRAIGRGAMADVYEARDGAGAPFAIKVLRSVTARDPEALARFEREAHVQELVRHPNVATIFGVGTTPHGAPYLVLELLRGRSLAAILREHGRLGARAAVTCAWQALHGLQATHAVGVLHRDLKPGNLMLEPADGGERVVLIDFGFAALEGAAGITQQGTVVGSLSYLAPERLRGEDADERSDLYGLAVVLYELLVGRPPFVGDDVDVLQGHLSGAPVPPSVAAPDAKIPQAVDALVLRALAKDRAGRPASATDMAGEIEAAARAWR
jgi:serine/threonine-protein kinase